MSKDFDKIKVVGAQKVHELTHIPLVYVQAILNRTYEDMTRIQLNGFISILEREYFLNLDELREDSSKYFNELAPKNNEASNVILSSKQKSSKAFYYTVLIIGVFIGVIYFSSSSSSQKDIESQDIDESLIISAQANMKTLKDKAKAQAVVQEVVQEKAQEVVQEVVQEKAPVVVQDVAQEKIIEKEQKIIVPKIKEEIVKKEETIINPIVQNKQINTNYFVIQPKSNLWLGYKDLDTGRSYQMTTEEEIQLDSKKTWLLVCGHGYIKIKLNGKTIEFNNEKTIRFLYKNGKIKRIYFRKYQELNAGG